MKKLLFLFFIISIQATAQKDIKVMSYNIRNSNAADGVNKWKNRKQTLANLILKVNPDVLGTQEVLMDQYRDLKKMLPSYDVFGVGRNNGKHGGEHSAIFYKRSQYDLIQGGNFWLSETPTVPGSKSWDAAITRICSWVKLKDKQNGYTFFVFNTHFDHRGKQARINSAKLLTQTIDSLCGDYPVVVTGDFNFQPDNEGFSVMTSKSHLVLLQDAYSADAPNYTDCGFEVSNTNCHRIDYIFYSHHFRRKSYALHTDNNGQYYPSDHLTISASFSLIK